MVLSVSKVRRETGTRSVRPTTDRSQPDIQAFRDRYQRSASLTGSSVALKSTHALLHRTTSGTAMTSSHLVQNFVARAGRSASWFSVTRLLKHTLRARDFVVVRLRSRREPSKRSRGTCSAPRTPPCRDRARNSSKSSMMTRDDVVSLYETMCTRRTRQSLPSPRRKTDSWKKATREKQTAIYFSKSYRDRIC